MGAALLRSWVLPRSRVPAVAVGLRHILRCVTPVMGAVGVGCCLAFTVHEESAAACGCAAAVEVTAAACGCAAAVEVNAAVCLNGVPLGRTIQPSSSSPKDEEACL